MSRRVIVTHDVADFDGFAAAVAATKLYPDATIVLRRTESPGLRSYLALHKDRFGYQRVSELDPKEVTGLVVVDVRRRGRLADFSELLLRNDAGLLPTDVWDHHPASPDDIPAGHARVAQLGAVTTLLVEVLQDRGIAIDEAEATLLALGIHEDTGSLTHDGSTPRDAAALSWLVGQGAHLSTVRRYLRPAMTPEQRDVLREILERQRLVIAGGSAVHVARIELDKMVEGLGPVVSQAAALGRGDALFASFVVAGKKVHVVGRSSTPHVDVGRVLRTVGGGGHAGAGSASIRCREPGAIDDAHARLDDAIAAEPGGVGVRHLMTREVVTVSTDTPLLEVRRMMEEHHISGVVVLKGEQLAGILSHRDIDKAERDGRLHLRVNSCMRRKVHTVDVDAPLTEAITRMSDHGIGRLPVLEGGQLVGLLSRSDLRRRLYEDDGDDR